DINHVGEWNRPNFRIHVIIYVLRHLEEAFINAKEKLRLLGMTEDALWKGDTIFAVGREFAAENRAHVRREAAAVDEHLQARRNNVLLDIDAVSGVFRGEQTFAATKFLKHFRQPFVEV